MRGARFRCVFSPSPYDTKALCIAMATGHEEPVSHNGGMCINSFDTNTVLILHIILSIQNCQDAEVNTWSGHCSVFLEGKGNSANDCRLSIIVKLIERINATNHLPYHHLLERSRGLQSISSPLSRYNSSSFYFS